MKSLLLQAVCSLFLFGSSFAQTWTGSISNDWNNANNWSPTAIPGTTSNVIIPGTVASNRWPVLAGNVTINTLATNYGSQLDVNGYTLTLSTVDANNNLQGLTVNNSVPANDIIITIAGGTGGFSTAFLRNTFNGNLVLNLHGYFYEGNVGAPDNSSASTYNGNTIINMNAVAAMGISNTNYSTFNGNLTVNRNARVTLGMFGAGGIVNGNFTFNDIGGGNTILGNTGYRNIPVSGTINISVNYPEYSDFSLHRFVNQTAGGSIHIQHAGVINITRDTLKVNSIALNNFSSNFVYFINNLIHGDVNISDNPANSYPTYIRANTIFGNSVISNNGTGTFLEADQPDNANTYNGTTQFIATSTGTLNISAVSKSNFNGNLSISREAAGITTAFGGGADITGDFLFVNTTGGATTLGNKNIRNTNIAGKIDIIAPYATSGTFSMFRLVNQTEGGNIIIQNSTGFDLYKDTLVVNSLSITGYKNGIGYLQNNKITGNIEIADDPANGNNNFTYIRSNYVVGNSAFACNGTNAFLDADQVGSINRYYGHVLYAKGNTGSINVGSGDTTIISGNLTLSSSVAIALTKIKFVGNSNSVFEQLGTQVMSIVEMIIQKSDAQYSLILEDSISMLGKLTFMKGHIISSTGKELIFSKTGSSNGASDQSHVIGPVVKVGNAAFTFPVGSYDGLQGIAMTAPATNLDRYRCEYHPMGPHPTYDTSLHGPDIKAMSICEYWEFRQEQGTSSLKLSFDFGNPTGLCGAVYDPNGLRIARWTGSNWENLGNGGWYGAMDGVVSTASTTNKFGIFTLASTTVIYPEITIQASTEFPVCKCKNVRFSYTTITYPGNTPFYQWQKNNVNVGTNITYYYDSTLNTGDSIVCLMTSSIQFSYPPIVRSNVIYITGTTNSNTWTGTGSSDWFNPWNWSCYSVPCESTDVVINPGTPYIPSIGAGIAKCRSLLLKTGASIQVSPSAKLEVTQQQ
jgi:hypothetical protein